MKSLSFVALFVLSTTSAPFLGACSAPASDEGDTGSRAAGATGAAGDTSEAAVVATTLDPGAFELYDQPGHVPTPGCDVHTHLVLANATCGATATLTEEIGGMCMIAVAPNPRVYPLQQSADACGSKIYTGTLALADGVHRVKITDHRTRMCLDAIPSRIIVEETVPGFPGAITTTKYSWDTQPVTCPAPGTTVDCMPPVDPTVDVLCQAQTRGWVTANCPGVGYTD